MAVSTRRTDLRNGIVYVYVWFDIEDYVTEETDGLPITALSIMNKYGVRATCKMVAEKVRELREHGRSDVVAAIAEHDVGYHLDTHSRHPVVYEYLADLDLLGGAKEFVRRERRGLEYVEDAFGRKASCYGHPGPAWAASYYPAMAEMGIPVYLDETRMLNLDDSPYWYCGVLNLNGANRNLISFDYTFEEPSGIERVKERFRKIHDRLQGRGGGAVSFMHHLHSTVNKEFWDAVNFADGKNRPREEYTRPPAQPAEVTERAWRNFEEIIRYMKSFSDVRFITASDAAEIYARRPVTYSRALVASVLKKLGTSIAHVRVKEDYASPSELFYLVTKCLSEYAENGKLPSILRVKEPLGPRSLERSTPAKSIKTADLLTASQRALERMESAGMIPSSVEVSKDVTLSSADFMATGVKVLKDVLSGSDLHPSTKVSKGRFRESKYVREDEFVKACRWRVLPRGFKGPKILEQVMLQTWTLRPAVPEPRR